MHTDLQALLDVQGRDAELRDLDARGAALTTEERALDGERAAAAQATERARAALEREQAKHGALHEKVAQHRQLHQRNVAQLDQVRRMREATAAQAQIEMARQLLSDEERELAALERRLESLREAHAAHEAAEQELVERQREPREQLAARRAELDAERAEKAAARDAVSRQVPASLLQRYERVRDRRSGDAVFPLRGLACGNCDTAIPLQRRNIMTERTAAEVCEACGVLLYVAAQ